jgi:AcrR family transcriptional regulator
MSLAQQGRTYRGASPRQRQEDRRARLVEAAIEVFGTVGYRGATVDRLCAEAGLTKRYFYESFDGSEQLLLAAYTRVTGELRDRLVAGSQGAGPELAEQVEAALRALFSAFDEDPRRARLAFVEVLGVSPAVDAAYRAVTESFAETLLELAPPALGGARAGRKIVATGLVGAVVFVAQQWVLTERREPVDTVVSSARIIVMSTLDALTAG